MTPTPFEKRLEDLQLMARPEDKQELDFLEEWLAWKAAGGVKDFEAEQQRRIRANYEQTNKTVSHLAGRKE
jgi:hypothetical protein